LGFSGEEGLGLQTAGNVQWVYEAEATHISAL